jgi:hypothetical protein
MADDWRSFGSNKAYMNKLIGLILVLAISGCAVCSQSDNAEQCRTKQRDHSQPRTDFASAVLDAGRRSLAYF